MGGSTSKRKRAARALGGEEPRKTTVQELSAAKRAAFLEDFARHGIVGEALKVSGGSRSLLAYWREDPAFEESYKEAAAASVDTYRTEARRRALGYERQVLYQGQPVYRVDPDKQRAGEEDVLERDALGQPVPVVEIVVHDRMLELMLKAHAPEHKERLELSGEVKQGGVLLVPQAFTAKDWEDLERQRVDAQAAAEAASKKAAKR